MERRQWQKRLSVSSLICHWSLDEFTIENNKFCNILLLTLLHIQRDCAFHDCISITSDTSLKRGIIKLPNDTTFTYDDEVSRKILPLKLELQNFFEGFILMLGTTNFAKTEMMCLHFPFPFTGQFQSFLSICVFQNAVFKILYTSAKDLAPWGFRAVYMYLPCTAFYGAGMYDCSSSRVQFDLLKSAHITHILGLQLWD